jgi:hypothetical protein
LDLRGLVEDHGSGKRFARVEMRLRQTRFGRLVTGVTIVALGGAATLGGLAFGTVLWWPAWAGLAAAAIIAGRWTWKVTRLVAATERAVDAGSAVCGFEPVELMERASVPAVDAGL